MLKNKFQTPPHSSHSSHTFKKPKQERVYDLSKQDSFLFNKTPILASALQKLKKHESKDKKKLIPSTTTPNKSNKSL